MDISLVDCDKFQNEIMIFTEKKKFSLKYLKF